MNFETPIHPNKILTLSFMLKTLPSTIARRLPLNAAFNNIAFISLHTQ
jgi:hypothetical protein